MVQIRSRVSSSYFPPQVGHSIPGRGFRPNVLDIGVGFSTMARGWQTRQPNLEETMTMYRPTVAEIDLTAIRDNLRAIRACIPLKAQVIGIVKADAYGHGAARVAAVLEQEQVRLLAVATPDEAVELRESGIMAEILVFGHSPADFVPYAVTNASIVGLYSHFACAESDPEFTALQAARFAAVVREVRAGGLQPAMVHLANSAGMFTSPGAMLDAVRPGILLYGCPPVPAPTCPVRPVLSLRTELEMVKELPAGHGIGYGRTFITDRPTRMALIPIGYADGYLRGLSNKAHVIVRGCFAPVVGRVSMDVCALDVTDIPAAVPADPVTLIGEQDGLSIIVDELAELMGTISYEVLTGISKRVPRIYLDRRT